MVRLCGFDVHCGVSHHRFPPFHGYDSLGRHHWYKHSLRSICRIPLCCGVHANLQECERGRTLFISRKPNYNMTSASRDSVPSGSRSDPFTEHIAFGYTKEWSNSKRKHYFFNHKTMKAIWERPKEVLPPGSFISYYFNLRAFEHAMSLRTGWKRVKSRKPGKADYYFNPTTKAVLVRSCRVAMFMSCRPVNHPSGVSTHIM